LSDKSVPSFFEFDPKIIPYQGRVLYDITTGFDYSLGTHELLLSGSVGSAKSILMAHIAVLHCVQHDGAIFGLGRKAMPDLKDTIFQDIIDHLDGSFIQDVDYWVNHTRASIQFRNGSRIVSRSWSDKKYKKWRSLRLSAGLIEELSENDEEDKEAYDEMLMRINRIPHINQPFLISATNPDDPDHWIFRRWLKKKKQTRPVYYSNTADNPFLPKAYIDNLYDNLDPLLAQRMIEGKWIAITGDGIYHQYDKRKNYIDSEYRINKDYPIHVSFDFNIALGKPMSACLFQFVDQTFHFFTESVIQGARTEDLLDDLMSRGLFDHRCQYIINGDATGKHSDTRNKLSDYDIISKYISNIRNKYKEPIRWLMRVPRGNPPIRKRHNMVNAYMCNAKGIRRLFVYKDAPTLNDGWSLTRLKKGGQYIEDDSKSYQHITTAAGYGIHSTVLNAREREPVQMIQR